METTDSARLRSHSAVGTEAERLDRSGRQALDDQIGVRSQREHLRRARCASCSRRRQRASRCSGSETGRRPRPRAASVPDAVHRRSGSPPGSSIFSTSAPASASSLVQYGPAISVDRSRTRTPASGRASRSAATAQDTTATSRSRRWRTLVTGERHSARRRMRSAFGGSRDPSAGVRAMLGTTARHPRRRLRRGARSDSRAPVTISSRAHPLQASPGKAVDPGCGRGGRARLQLSCSIFFTSSCGTPRNRRAMVTRLFGQSVPVCG